MRLHESTDFSNELSLLYNSIFLILIHFSKIGEERSLGGFKGGFGETSTADDQAFEDLKGVDFGIKEHSHVAESELGVSPWDIDDTHFVTKSVIFLINSLFLS